MIEKKDIIGLDSNQMLKIINDLETDRLDMAKGFVSYMNNMNQMFKILGSTEEIKIVEGSIYEKSLQIIKESK